VLEEVADGAAPTRPLNWQMLQMLCLPSLPSTITTPRAHLDAANAPEITSRPVSYAALQCPWL